MSYTALYRKFRPAVFEDVKGQDHIVTTLKNQIRGDRVGHAYLFTGTRGTGKTTIAKIFARSVNCESPSDGSPCGNCPTCQAIAAGTSLNVIEIDAASNNGVDSIREIVDEVSYSPTQGKFKVYIIDEVHMLSTGAFNALLKTLEEPPSYVIFILATTEVHKIPVTILSRCQRYDFRRISIDTITARLEDLAAREQVQAEEKALRYVAKMADGSMRDALSLLDQCIAFHYGDLLTYDKALEVLGAVDTGVFSELLRYILDGNVAGCIAVLEEMVIQGRDLTQFVSDLTWYLRNLLLIKTADGGEIENVMDISSDNLAKLKEEAQMTETEVIMRYIRVLSELSGALRTAAQKRVLIEINLIRLCKPQMQTDYSSILDRIRTLENQVKNGVVAIDDIGGERAVSARQPRPIEKKKLEKALPEDVRLVVQKWHQIVSGFQMPLRRYLSSCRLSLGADDVLLLVTTDFLAYGDLSNPETQEFVKDGIADVIGKTVELEVRQSADEVELEEKYPDLGMIQFEVDVEE